MATGSQHEMIQFAGFVNFCYAGARVCLPVEISPAIHISHRADISITHSGPVLAAWPAYFARYRAGNPVVGE